MALIQLINISQKMERHIMGIDSPTLFIYEKIYGSVGMTKCLYFYCFISLLEY